MLSETGSWSVSALSEVIQLRLISTLSPAVLDNFSESMDHEVQGLKLHLLYIHTV